MNLAQGDAGQFTAVEGSYHEAQEVTGRRMYLEAMEEVLRAANKVIADTQPGAASAITPYLPLPPPARAAVAAVPAP